MLASSHASPAASYPASAKKRLSEARTSLIDPMSNVKSSTLETPRSGLGLLPVSLPRLSVSATRPLDTSRSVGDAGNIAPRPAWNNGAAMSSLVNDDPMGAGVGLGPREFRDTLTGGPDVGPTNPLRASLSARAVGRGEGEPGVEPVGGVAVGEPRDIMSAPHEEIAMLRRLLDQVQAEKIGLELRAKNEMERLSGELRKALGMLQHHSHERESLAKARAEQDFIVREINELQTQLAQAKQEKKQAVADMLTERDGRELEMREVKRQLTQARKEIAQLQGQVVEQDEQLGTAHEVKHRTIQRSRADKRLLLKEIMDYKVQVSHLQQEKEEIKMMATAERDVFVRDARATEERLRISEQQVHELRCTIQELTEQLNQANEYKDRLINQGKLDKHNLTTEVKNLKQELASTKQARRDAALQFQTEYDRSATRVQELERQLEAARLEATEAKVMCEGRIARWTDRIDRLHTVTATGMARMKLPISLVQPGGGEEPSSEVGHVVDQQLTAIKRRFYILEDDRTKLVQRLGDLKPEAAKPADKVEEEKAAEVDRRLNAAVQGAGVKLREMSSTAHERLNALFTAAMDPSVEQPGTNRHLEIANKRTHDFQTQIEATKQEIKRLGEELRGSTDQTAILRKSLSDLRSAVSIS